MPADLRGEFVGNQWRIPGAKGVSLIAPAERESLLPHVPDAGRVIEIGTYQGVTARWIATQFPNTTVLCIDNFTCGAFAAACWVENRLPNMHLWVGDVQSWIRECDALELAADLVLVDGNHSYEGCSADLGAAKQIVVPGGIIAVHDYGARCFEGVGQAIADRLTGWEQVSLVGRLICFRRP